MVFAMTEFTTSSAAANRDGKARHAIQKVSEHIQYGKTGCRVFKEGMQN